MPCRGPDYSEDGSITIEKLKSEVDNLTQILCTISDLPPSSTVTSIYAKIPAFRDFVTKHREVDELRWYEFYKNKYPGFNKVEIIKMVRNDILKPV